jgi:histone H2A
MSTNGGYSKPKPKSQSVRAGLLFPVGRVKRHVRERAANGMRVGRGTPVFLAAVLEKLVAQVIERAGRLAQEAKRTRIVPLHLKAAVCNHVDLNPLFNKVVFPRTSSIPVVRREIQAGAGAGAAAAGFTSE